MFFPTFQYFQSIFLKVNFLLHGVFGLPPHPLLPPEDSLELIAVVSFNEAQRLFGFFCAPPSVCLAAVGSPRTHAKKLSKSPGIGSTLWACP
jgi:hypothetical protein